MKQILPLLFLILTTLTRPTPAIADIDFQISNFEKIDDYYSIDAEITGASTGSSYFVQSLFTSVESNSYFGFTWSQKGDWFKYIASPDKEYIREYFPLLEVSVSQKILIKPDYDSSKYKGPGGYYLKLRRYTGNGTSHSGESNTITVQLSETLPTPSPTETPSPTQTLAPTYTPTQTSTPTQSPTKISTPTPTPTPTPKSQVSPSPTSTNAVKPAVSSTPAIVLQSENSTQSVSESAVLGSSVDQEASVSPNPTKVDNVTRKNTNIYKYLFVFGAGLSSISGTWLYLRHKTD